jgi:cell division protein FtsN
VKPSPGKTAGKRTSSAKTASEGKLMVQAAAFRVRNMAESFRQRLEKGGFKATVVRGKRGKSAGYYKVFVGPYPNKDAARRTGRSGN